MCECALRICFSLDLINFSGADSLHMIYSAELTRWVIFDSFVLATYGSQAYHKASIEAERVNALVKIHEIPPWGDGNLADRGVIKYFPILLHFEKMDV